MNETTKSIIRGVIVIAIGIVSYLVSTGVENLDQLDPSVNFQGFLGLIGMVLTSVYGTFFNGSVVEARKRDNGQ